VNVCSKEAVFALLVSNRWKLHFCFLAATSIHCSQCHGDCSSTSLRCCSHFRKCLGSRVHFSINWAGASCSDGPLVSTKSRVSNPLISTKTHEARRVNREPRSLTFPIRWSQQEPLRAASKHDVSVVEPQSVVTGRITPTGRSLECDVSIKTRAVTAHGCCSAARGGSEATPCSHCSAARGGGGGSCAACWDRMARTAADPCRSSAHGGRRRIRVSGTSSCCCLLPAGTSTAQHCSKLFGIFCELSVSGCERL